MGALASLVCRAWAGPAAGVRDAADAGFRQMVARFIDGEMRLSPVHATEDGNHRFDDRLSDYSQSRDLGEDPSRRGMEIALFALARQVVRTQ